MSLLRALKRKAAGLKKWRPLRTPSARQLSRDEAHSYWRTPPGENQPENYILGRDEKALERSRHLAEMIASESSASDSILEIGCNVGRNLNVLFQSGIRNLSGIDISTDALRLLKSTYPDLARVVQLYEGSVEGQIGSFDDGQFDVVFTMAVLQHIHYDSDFIFQEIARVTKSRLIVMENESYPADRNFRRNYKKVFENVGMVQVLYDDRVPSLPGYCRVFRHREH